MARYRGPKTKIARKFGEPIFGPDKVLEKRTTHQVCMGNLDADVKSLNTVFS